MRQIDKVLLGFTALALGAAAGLVYRAHTVNDVHMPPALADGLHPSLAPPPDVVRSFPRRVDVVASRPLPRVLPAPPPARPEGFDEAKAKDRCVGGVLIKVSGNVYTQDVGADGRAIPCH